MEAGLVGAEVPSYKGFRFPAEIISHGIWLYHRFPLSFREVEEMMLERGIVVSHETIRQWCAKFDQTYANGLRRRRARPGDKWHLDEVYIKIAGKTHYLWRAVDQHDVVRRRPPASDPGVEHRQSKYLNNRAENSHQPTRQQERAMRHFRSPGGAQRFLSAFSGISPHFRPRRHRLSAEEYRREMDTRFTTWNEITGTTTAAA